jgi:hypothetical protein
LFTGVLILLGNETRYSNYRARWAGHGGDSAAEHRAINKVISLKWNEGKKAVQPKNLASNRERGANLGHHNTTVQGFGISKCGGGGAIRAGADGQTAKANQLNKT